MKIIMVDKYFFIKGGAERYFFELSKILEQRGHEVIPFSMKHPQNYASQWSGYFVDRIDFNPSTLHGKAITGAKSLGRIIYSMQAKRNMERLVDRVKPDIAHIHMIDHQISPSILPVFQSRGIPVVQTVHTYKPVCPSYRLYNMQKNRICEKCLDGRYYHAVLERCHKGSIGASFLVAMEMYMHAWTGLFRKNIDVYHVPSEFMGRKLKQGGIDPEKITHQFYTIDMDAYPPRFDNDGYFIYYGRLSAEKGISALLQAFAQLDDGLLKIVGTGPERQHLEETSSALGLGDRVEFTGALYGDDLKKIVSGARFVVVPSDWYDNSPLVIYESLCMGKPVVGADMGGIPELIEHGKDGFVFKAGDVDGLAGILRTMLMSGDISHMGRAARKKAEGLFDPEAHYQKMMSIYASAAERKHS